MPGNPAPRDLPNDARDAFLRDEYTPSDHEEAKRLRTLTAELFRFVRKVARDEDVPSEIRTEAKQILDHNE